jgi:MFS superfamily sulfate permease-like transporter
LQKILECGYGYCQLMACISGGIAIAHAVAPTLRSTIERGHREAAWLDQHGDLIQILVLQNYLFFGNAQSLLSYITSMFDDSDGNDSQDLVAIPPAPLHIIMDFAIVSGMDTSAVDLLQETITLCKNHQCRLFLSGMSQTLQFNLLYAGIKPDGKTLYFQPDLNCRSERPKMDCSPTCFTLWSKMSMTPV